MYGGGVGHEERRCEHRAVLATPSANNPAFLRVGNSFNATQKLSKIAASVLSDDYWRATRRAIARTRGPRRRAEAPIDASPSEPRRASGAEGSPTPHWRPLARQGTGAYTAPTLIEILLPNGSKLADTLTGVISRASR